MHLASMNFYEKILTKAIKKELLDLNDRILVIAAGEFDRSVFNHIGFINVIITNIDYDRGVKYYEPYNWEYQDAENLSYDDEEFDWVFVHAGLHHCASPHRGLCEMLRVAKKGVGVFEARDSLLNIISTKLGLVPLYELEPCVLSKGAEGGLRNSNIPNFIYRWTEREVMKTVNSYLPHYKHKFYFNYGILIPIQRLSMSPNVMKRIIGYAAYFISPLFRFLFPKQGNQFAFLILKTRELQPWLEFKNSNFIFKLNYIEGRFHPSEYMRGAFYDKYLL